LLSSISSYCERKQVEENILGNQKNIASSTTESHNIFSIHPQKHPSNPIVAAKINVTTKECRENIQLPLSLPPHK
jgi:hypothetical protein